MVSKRLDEDRCFSSGFKMSFGKMALGQGKTNDFDIVEASLITGGPVPCVANH